MDNISTIYRIEQGFKYVEEDWWKWWVWIEGKEGDLDEIDYVVYTLHSTFANPIRKIEDRSTKFELKTEGWGVFTIYAKLYLKDKSEITLAHDLYLEYPDGESNLAL